MNAAVTPRPTCSARLEPAGGGGVPCPPGAVRGLPRRGRGARRCRARRCRSRCRSTRRPRGHAPAAHARGAPRAGCVAARAGCAAAVAGGARPRQLVCRRRGRGSLPWRRSCRRGDRARRRGRDDRDPGAGRRGSPAALRCSVTDGHAELVVRHLTPPGHGHVYEVWLQSGKSAPVPASVLFGVISDGNADVGIPGKTARRQRGAGDAGAARRQPKRRRTAR